MQRAFMNTKICENSLDSSAYPFSFTQSACESCGGKCCVGESGYVFLSIAEMEQIAKSLDLSLEVFAKQYVRKIGYRFSLIEKPYNDSGRESLACVFFDVEKKCCGIYDKRPKQCRSYPFWEAHKSLDSLAQLKSECKGIVPRLEALDSTPLDSARLESSQKEGAQC